MRSAVDLRRLQTGGGNAGGNRRRQGCKELRGTAAMKACELDVDQFDDRPRGSDCRIPFDDCGAVVRDAREYPRGRPLPPSASSSGGKASGTVGKTASAMMGLSYAVPCVVALISAAMAISGTFNRAYERCRLSLQRHVTVPPMRSTIASTAARSSPILPSKLKVTYIFLASSLAVESCSLA